MSSDVHVFSGLGKLILHLVGNRILISLQKQRRSSVIRRDGIQNFMQDISRRIFNV